ncbi:MAG TPA: FAD-dependent oxidoreductase [archaeon]|nr:FAD-dependent oxidoreductase [archaeon]
MAKNVVIIGGGAVGMSVATYLKRHTNHNVVVFSSESYTAYSQCGLPFVLEGKISGFNNLIVKSNDALMGMGIALHLDTLVNIIDANNQKVISDIGVFNYDYLIISTGSRPFIPPIQGRELKGVFPLHIMSDAIAIDKSLNNTSRVLIIGAGGIGVEIAASLVKRGLETTLVEALSQVLPLTLDPDMASLIGNYLNSLGVRVITGIQVESINGSQHVESVTVGGEIFLAETVIVATGLRPNVDIAGEAGFDIGPTGGIVTDERLRVSYQGEFLDNVYSGGECAQVIDLITGQPTISRLGSAARRMARVIGENLNGKISNYPPTLSPNVVAVGDLVAGQVGITSHIAQVNDISVVSGSSKGLTRAGYYPGARPLHIKLLFANEKLVGAQVISHEGVKERIDAFSLAIRMGATVDDLLRWETSYAPPVSGVIDPVTFAVDDARKNMEATA